jgi:hypothetical protein
MEETMNRQRLSTFSGAIAGTLCAVLALALAAHASERRDFTEEFHQTYALAAEGTVELDNLNGAVHINVWDRNEVKVDAVKYAGTKERLDEAHIEVDAGPSNISITTRYPDHDHTFNWGSRNNPAGVDYTLTIPRNARLDEIKLVNGALDITGVKGDVSASSFNGRVDAHNLGGRVELETSTAG